MRPLKEYIGIPYEVKNCWDLVRDYYKGQFSIDLLQYYEGKTPDRDETGVLIKTNMGDFDRVSSPEVGDLVLIKLYGFENHIAIYAERGVILHTTKGIGSHLDSLSRYEHLVSGYFRHRKNPCD